MMARRFQKKRSDMRLTERFTSHRLNFAEQRGKFPRNVPRLAPESRSAFARGPDFRRKNCGASTSVDPIFLTAVWVAMAALGFALKKYPRPVMIAGVSAALLSFAMSPIANSAADREILLMAGLGYVVGGLVRWGTKRVRAAEPQWKRLERELNVLGNQMERTFALLAASPVFKAWLGKKYLGLTGRMMIHAYDYCFGSRPLWFAMESNLIQIELSQFTGLDRQYLRGNYNAFYQSKRLPVLAIILAAEPFRQVENSTSYQPPREGWMRLVLEAAFYAHIMKDLDPGQNPINPLDPEGRFKSPDYYRREIERFEEALKALEARFPLRL